MQNTLTRGKMVRVRINHPHFPGKIGIFQFMGGPRGDVIVLAEPDNGQVLFCVSQKDLCN